jgi:23S rRNA (uracil1939-C5)-methyltransferase
MGRLGYFARGSHELVPIEKCLIAEDQINDSIKNFSPTNKKSHLFTIDNEELGGFSQVNSSQNKQLIDYILKLSKQEDYEEIYDLYSGSGNFTFPLLKAHTKSQILAVELSPSSVQQAQTYIKAENLSPKKIQFYLSDVFKFLKRRVLSASSLVVLDPPRSGCSDEVIFNLAKQKFKRLIYISCNPSTLGRDLKNLLSTSANSLQISSVQPFDMFPQTDHIEVVVELVIDS